MATALRGKAALTLARTTDGRVVYVYKGRPAPTNLADGERSRLVGDGYLEEYEVEAAASGDVPEPGGSSIAKIRAYVGDDPARAKAYLDAELARPVDDQRAGLVDALEKIADPA